MSKPLRTLGILTFCVGFAVLLFHGWRVYRIQAGLAELTDLRDSIIGDDSGPDAVDRFENQYIAIREEYRERGISHPHYEEAFAQSPMYYGAGLIFVLIGGGMYLISRRAAPAAATEPPGDSRTDSDES